MSLPNGVLLKERYRIDSVLGQGGMGAVYQATDELLGMHVAVKENLFLSPEYTRQFEQEAKILASLRHRSLPRVIDFYRIPDQGQYLIMDCIEGEDLRDLIKRHGYMNEKDVALLGFHICEALNYLHKQLPPVIHRDIKPGNIKITKNQEVFLVDFGLAKFGDDPLQMTITGARAMTPGYSPPEQYGTARTDARSDIYSLGATLYNALTGAVPEDALDRVTQRIELTPILHYRNETEPNLARVIEHSMEVDAGDRYQSAIEFQRELLNAMKMESLALEAGMLSHFDSITPEMGEFSSREGGSLSSNGSQKPPKENISTGEKRDQLSFQIRLIGILIFMIMVGYFIMNPGFPEWIRWQAGIGSTLAVTKIPESVSLTNDNLENGIPRITSTANFTPAMTAPTPTRTLEVVPTATPEATTANEVLEATAVVTVETNQAPISLAIDHPIVFASNRDGSMQLWLMRSDGSDQIRLTDMASGACQPDWSPDNTKIIFISPCGKIQDIYEDAVLYVYNFDDKSILPLMTSGEGIRTTGNFEPTWSPDGEFVAYSSYNNRINHIFLYSLDTKETLELSNSPYDERQPAWYPDGSRLLFSRKRVNWVIWSILPNGNEPQQVSVSGNVSNTQAVWSLDGNYILFSQIDNSKVPELVKLFTGNFATSLEDRIKVRDVEFSMPVIGAKFSNDGKKIIFESWPDGSNRDIYMMDLDGTNLYRLTTNPNYDIDPDWQN